MQLWVGALEPVGVVVGGREGDVLAVGAGGGYGGAGEFDTEATCAGGGGVVGVVELGTSQQWTSNWILIKRLGIPKQGQIPKTRDCLKAMGDNVSECLRHLPRVKPIKVCLPPEITMLFPMLFSIKWLNVRFRLAW